MWEWKGKWACFTKVKKGKFACINIKEKGKWACYFLVWNGKFACINIKEKRWGCPVHVVSTK